MRTVTAKSEPATPLTDAENYRNAVAALRRLGFSDRMIAALRRPDTGSEDHRGPDGASASSLRSIA